MPAALPVVVQVVATPAPSEDQLRALVESCSGAVGARGCALAETDSGGVRARVIVLFGDELGRVHVEMQVSDATAAVPATRDADFRASDPSLDRYRAAGLLAAGLVLDREREPQAAPASVPSQAPAANPVPTAVLLPADAPLVPPAPLDMDRPPRPTDLTADVAATAVVASTGDRPWWDLILSADVGARRSPVFATASVLYGGTWTSNAAGISERRFAAGAGVGLRFAISGPISLRASAEAQLNDLEASIVQPGTGRNDAGGRWLVGVGADIAVVIPIAGPVDLEVGGRAAWLGSSTVVRVQGQPATVIAAWTEGVALGLETRFR